MSRYEIAELEQELRAIDAAEDDEEEEETTTEELAALRKDPEYRKYLQKLKQLQKLRHGVIKRYFDKFKYKRAHRNEIIESAEESELVFEQVMGPDHVHFMDAHPDIRKFMDNVNRDQTKKEEAVVEKRGRKIGDLPDIERLKKDDVKV